jgi:hypothetical protein
MKTASPPGLLPPERRPIGQLVGEAIRLYGRRFWPSLALGLGPVAAGFGVTVLHGVAQIVFVLTVGSAALTCSYIGAVMLASGARPEPEAAAAALGLGMLVFLPVPLLNQLFVLPAVFWLALFGFVVPVALLERPPLGRTFGRSLQLARADYVHAAGALATLVIISLLSSYLLFFLLRGQAQAARDVAALASVLVISPLLFLGAALLYYDQAARVKVRA